MKNKNSLPEEVKLIFQEVSRIRYKKLKEAGWCVTCTRKPATDTVRCDDCRIIYYKKQEKRNRNKGIKPWTAGKAGRPPKKEKKE